MRKIIFIALLMPTVALADDAAFDQWLLNEALGRNQPQQTVPAYGVPVQPVLPVPQDRGPWGTGYSIVTNTRPTKNLWDRDLTGSETVQRVVPNDATGQPMKGFNVNNW
jgi:hypothetical protein